MLWIGQSFSTPAFLRSRLIFGILVGAAASLFFAWILFQMERNNASYRASVMESGVAGTQLELEEETEEENNNKDGDAGSHGYVQAGTEDGDTACGGVSTRNHGSKGGSSSIEKADALFKAQADSHSRSRSLTRSQQITIVLHVSLLILMNYLLLVFLPGSAILSFLAMAAIWGLALSPYLRDELQRRERWDRLLTLVALFFVLAGSLTLIHYCRLALRDGSVYQGPARIVGFDAGVYENSDAETLRTDLQVTWGGPWGCPDNADRICTATVEGALCETEYDVEDYASVEYEDDDGNNRRRHRRRRQMKRRFLNNNNNNNNSDAQGDAADADQDGGDADAEDGNDGQEFTEAEEEEMAEAEEEEEEEYEEELDEEYEEALDEDIDYVEEEADVEVEEYEDEVYEEAEEVVDEYEDELDEEYDEEVEEVEEEEEYEEEEIAVEAEDGGDEELVEENTELNEENEELEEDLEDEEEYAEELEDEIAEMTGSGGYSYNDDAFEDDYWNTDWSSVWGEYACEDLFDEDLEGQGYNPNDAPGHDQWPTIEIYGSCNSCEAYIADYFSSEHYLKIRLYEVQAWLYLWVGFIGLIISAFAALREHYRPSRENEVVLLTNDGGVPA